MNFIYSFLFRNSRIVSIVVVIVLVGTKCACVNRWSNITNMSLWPLFVLGRSTIKSILMDCHFAHSMYKCLFVLSLTCNIHNTFYIFTNIHFHAKQKKNFFNHEISFLKSQLINNCDVMTIMEKYQLIICVLIDTQLTIVI